MKLKNAEHTCICIHFIVLFSVQKQFPIYILPLFHYLLKNFLPANIISVKITGKYFWAYKSHILDSRENFSIYIGIIYTQLTLTNTETLMADRVRIATCWGLFATHYTFIRTIQRSLDVFTFHTTDSSPVSIWVQSTPIWLKSGGFILKSWRKFICRYVHNCLLW